MEDKPLLYLDRDKWIRRVPGGVILDVGNVRLDVRRFPVEGQGMRWCFKAWLYTGNMKPGNDVRQRCVSIYRRTNGAFGLFHGTREYEMGFVPYWKRSAQ